MPKTKRFSISHSKMSLYRRCKQSYHWKYVEKRFPPSSLGQVRGTCGHVAMEEWHRSYNAQAAMNAAWATWTNKGYRGGDDWMLLEDALNRYFPWSLTHDTFRLVKSEIKFDIELEVSGQPVFFIGYIDGIVEEDGGLWLMEHKFLKRMDNSDKSLDPQVSLYMLAAEILGHNVRGVIYNKVRVANTKIAEREPAVRTRLHRTQEGLVTVRNDLVIQVQEMLEYQKGGVPYRNPTRDCSWDCPFYTACLSMSTDGQVPIQLLDAVTQKRKN